MIIDINEIYIQDMSIQKENMFNFEIKNYFDTSPYYKLLTYMSEKFIGTNILDLGTYRGGSALALGASKKNRIYSFDVTAQEIPFDIEKFDNIKFEIIESLDYIKDELILSSPLIYLDIDHYGIEELKFIDRLNKLNYVGILLMDDIELNDEMKSMWNKIENKKYNLTKEIGPQGFGIVLFNTEIKIIK